VNVISVSQLLLVAEDTDRRIISIIIIFSDFQDPYAVVVLLQNDLVVIDLLTSGFPCFENPYPMDIHESPVTCCAYFADCPSDLVPAFYSVGSKSQKKTGFSEKEWPISGGEWSSSSSSYNEIILTG
jgi:syntaxin-binding protein 5